MAVQIGSRRWRLEQNPIFSKAVAYRDIVEADIDEHGELVIGRIVERSPFKTVHTFAPRMLYFSDFGKAFLDRIMGLGGMWDSFAWGIFVFSYPEDAHDEIEQMYREAVREARCLEMGAPDPLTKLYRKRPEGGADPNQAKN